MTTTASRSPLDMIRHLDPCPKAVEWLAGQPSAAEAWRTCERGDWMLWLIGHLSGPVGGKSRKKLVLAACECARLGLPYVRKGEDRPRKAIETAERYARGELGVTLDDVRNASSYAHPAYTVAVAKAAVAVAKAAADAPYAVAAAAPYAVAVAAVASSSTVAYLRRCADIVRKHYPEPPRIRK